MSLISTSRAPNKDTNTANFKVALVTGGSRGLGKSSVLALAAKGTDILFTYNNREDKAAEVVNAVETLGQKAIALQLDVSQRATFADFTNRIKAELNVHWNRKDFDILVNNAGIGISSPIETTTEADFDLLMNIHLKGPYFLTQALLPYLADNARIINVSTGLTRFSVPGYSAYAMMKGGVEVFTRYLAKELGARGISVNTIAPGVVETDFRDGAVRNDPNMKAFLGSQTALGRIGQPDDIGHIVASMCQDENRWINAERIEASGGMFI